MSTLLRGPRNGLRRLGARACRWQSCRCWPEPARVRSGVRVPVLYVLILALSPLPLFETWVTASSIARIV